MTDREKLTRDIDRALTAWNPSTDADGSAAIADALIAAGWRLIPSEGEAFEAMVGRAAEAMAGYESNEDGLCRFEMTRVGLLAALGGDAHV